ncbi:uncharacterized protein LOC109830451 [Asparagus officinalis]|uniref:uncharacterized protein LOC109830451 n=1 Tax=Asparagus officinalis TaxID=4686 RepID=UPI00098E6D22|nr:uncharacterized protein LOC109830451 [Asparagus officinalis]
MASAEGAAFTGTGEEGGGDNTGNHTAIVTFPRRNRGWAQHEPLKIETLEESNDTNPSNMWQVYALGGFMVARWLWAKYKERKNGERGEGPSD